MLARVGILGALTAAFALIATMPSVQADKFKRDEVAAVWARVDLDRDGTATPAEVNSTNSRLAESFKQADADHDGFLTFQEFEALLMNS